jgi:hypothetical protein
MAEEEQFLQELQARAREPKQLRANPERMPPVGKCVLPFYPAFVFLDAHHSLGTTDTSFLDHQVSNYQQGETPTCRDVRESNQRCESVL